jgi:spore maturation protein CgeB
MYGGSSTIGNYLYAALLNCGYDAKILDFSKFYDGYKYIGEFTPNEDHVNSLKQMLVNLMSEALLSSVFNDAPDLVIFMAQSPAGERTLLKLKSMGIKTAYWFVEDYHTLTYWGSVAKNVDYFFTIQKEGFFEELKNMGLSNYHYLPLACLPDFHKKITPVNKEDEARYGSDVSFAGAGYFNRKNAFSQLMDFNFKIWGGDWFVGLPLSLFIQEGGKRFSEEEAVKIYNYSKININIHSSMWHWDINPNGDFLNPRVYEILGCGGFQLVDKRSYLEGIFEDGKDLVVFEDTADLRKKIKYYLANEEERQAIAARGYETVRKRHTYEQRVQEMMNIILLDSYDSIRSKLVSRKENVFKLLKETEGNEELHKLISEFSDKNAVSIKDLVDYIKKGKGRLSKTEAMILMLWAIKSKLVKLDGL